MQDNNSTSIIRIPSLIEYSTEEKAKLLPSITDIPGFSSFLQFPETPFNYYRVYKPQNELSLSNCWSSDFYRYASFVQQVGANVYLPPSNSTYKDYGKSNLSSSSPEASPERNNYEAPIKNITSQSISFPVEDGSFVCHWDACRASFSTRTGLATHCSTHLSIYSRGAKRAKIQILCKWNSCFQTFDTLKQLAKHLSEEDHIGQTPFLSKQEDDEDSQIYDPKKKYACSFPGCGKSFSDSSNRKKHERTHDSNRERFYCSEPGCTKSYSTKTDLNIHAKVHKGEFSQKCTHPNCNKAFVRLSELYAHERTHDNILPHACSYCGKRFREKARLRRHEELHLEQGQFQNKPQMIF